MGKKSPQSHVVLYSNAIADRLTNRIGIIGDLSPVIVGDAHEILEEGLDMQRVHPFLKVLVFDFPHDPIANELPLVAHRIVRLSECFHPYWDREVRHPASLSTRSRS